MAEEQRFRCAIEARAHDEPMLGTASRVRRWLLIEQAGPWGRDALLESRIPAEVAAAVKARTSPLGIRVLLIRRPGWPDDVAPRRVYVVRTADDGRWIEQLDLDRPDDVLDLDLAAVESPTPPGIGRPGPEAVHLVCTNGRHDPCCADFGRPVARALEVAGTPEVWESSHVGGDRFAANVVCLPTGVYFGRVEAASAHALLDDHARGVLWLDHYRGRSSASPLLQAAEIHVRRRLEERHLDGLPLVSAEELGADRLRAVFRAAEGATADVTVVRERGEPEHLTCTAAAESHPWRYRVESLSVEPG